MHTLSRYGIVKDPSRGYIFCCERGKQRDASQQARIKARKHRSRPSPALIQDVTSKQARQHTPACAVNFTPNSGEVLFAPAWPQSDHSTKRQKLFELHVSCDWRLATGNWQLTSKPHIKLHALDSITRRISFGFGPSIACMQNNQARKHTHTQRERGGGAKQSAGALC